MLNGLNAQSALRRDASEASPLAKETLHWWSAAPGCVSLTRSELALNAVKG